LVQVKEKDPLVDSQGVCLLEGAASLPHTQHYTSSPGGTSASSILAWRTLTPPTGTAVSDIHDR